MLLRNGQSILRHWQVKIAADRKLIKCQAPVPVVRWRWLTLESWLPFGVWHVQMGSTLRYSLWPHWLSRWGWWSTGNRTGVWVVVSIAEVEIKIWTNLSLRLHHPYDSLWLSLTGECNVNLMWFLYETEQKKVSLSSPFATEENTFIHVWNQHERSNKNKNKNNTSALPHKHKHTHTWQLCAVECKCFSNSLTHTLTAGVQARARMYVCGLVNAHAYY